MLISDATMRALDRIATREEDLMQAFTPGAIAQERDVVRSQRLLPAMDPLSVCAPAESYFVVAGSHGGSLFTRDGTFALRDGALVDSSGNPLLGYAAHAAPLAPLRADSADVALGFVKTARVQTDGSVTYERPSIDPRTGQREVQRVSIGQLALARFAAGTNLREVDAQHAAAPDGIAPHLGRAGDGNFEAVIPFARASSGVDIDLGLQRLQEAYMALDAIRAAGKAQGGIQKTAMDLLK